MRKIIVTSILNCFYILSISAQVSPELKRAIDSIINLNEDLKTYKNLSSCKKIQFIDSVVQYSDVSIFNEDYLRYAIFDMCIVNNVKGHFDNSSWSLPVYNTKEKYFKISKKWKRKSRCKKKQ